jgi:hypothetical protein
MAPPVILWWVWVAFVALNAIDFIVEGIPSPRFGAVVAAILLLVTVLMYTLALRPCVVTSEHGLTVRNPFRWHEIPWQLIHAVDTGEWVRVHYAAGGPADAAGSDSATGSNSAATQASPGNSASSAGDKMVPCWALYVSARARRKIASGPPRQRQEGRRRGLSAWAKAPAEYGATARLPEEARYLASLPIAKAMATRLDTRAERERAKAKQAGATITAPPAARARWAWPEIAAVVIPALILIIVIVA